MIAGKIGTLCLALVAALVTSAAFAREGSSRAGKCYLQQLCATTVYQPADAALRDRYLQPSDKSSPANRTAASLPAFKKQLAALQPGDVVDMTTPLGLTPA